MQKCADNNEYGMTVNMATVFSKDGTVSVEFKMNDSDGFDIEIEHDADNVDDAYRYILNECSTAAFARTKEKLEERKKSKQDDKNNDKDGDMNVNELLDEIRSLKIDNQILEQRCKDLSKKYNDIATKRSRKMDRKSSFEDIGLPGVVNLPKCYGFCESYTPMFTSWY